MTDISTVDQLCWAGIDTHADFHVVALTSANGELLETRKVSSAASAILECADWLTGLELNGIGIETTSSYGATITMALLATDQPVWEVTAP